MSFEWILEALLALFFGAGGGTWFAWRRGWIFQGRKRSTPADEQGSEPPRDEAPPPSPSPSPPEAPVDRGPKADRSSAGTPASPLPPDRGRPLDETVGGAPLPDESPSEEELPPFPSPSVQPGRGWPEEGARPSTPPPGGGFLGGSEEEQEPSRGPSSGPRGPFSPPPTPAPENPAEEVRISTVVPEAVRPGERFPIFVMFHVPGYEVRPSEGQVVDQNVDSVEVAEGTRLTVRLVPMDEGVFEIDEPEDSCLWRPPSQRTEFRLRAAKDLEEDLYDLRAEFWCGQVRLNRTYIQVEVSADAKRHRARRPEVVRRLPRSAFASYSRLDKIRVGERVESLKSVGIDVFLDCLDIQPAEKWQEVLERELASREALLLFWSTPASKSEWVEKEWRFALERHGEDHILPNALEPPLSCEPPKELAHLQFGSVLTELTEKWRRDAPES